METKIFKDKILIQVPSKNQTFEHKKKLEEYLNNLPIVVELTKLRSDNQNKLIHLLIRQYAQATGTEPLRMKQDLKTEFSEFYQIENLSFKNCTSQVADTFIDYLIEKALHNDVDLYLLNRHSNEFNHIVDIDKHRTRHIIACLKNRVCCICGKRHNEYMSVDLHHWFSVSSIGGMQHDDGLKTPFLPLCREHHSEFHSIGIESFKEKYIIEGIWLNKQLVYDLLPVYPNHFALFRKRLKEGYYKDVKRNNY